MVISQEDMEHWTTIRIQEKQERWLSWDTMAISGWYTHFSSLTLCNGIAPVLNHLWMGHLPSCNVKMYPRLVQHQQYGFNRPKLGCQFAVFSTEYFFPEMMICDFGMFPCDCFWLSNTCASIVCSIMFYLFHDCVALMDHTLHWRNVWFHLSEAGKGSWHNSGWQR